MNIPELVHHMARDAKSAARRLGTLSRGVKDRIILRAAELLQERRTQIQAANRRMWRRPRPRATPRPSLTG